ncbi:hypothetical protein [Variovorax sp. W6]|uniref:hypothetical protein n=1 Tax=Variovorax sp. W6 TaxID=3093895 RepID=UPI003D80480E
MAITARRLMRRPALPALVLAVAATHAVALWLLVIATRPNASSAPRSAKRVVMELVQVAPEVKIEPPAARAPAAPSLRAGAVRTPRPVRSNVIATPNASSAAPESPQAASPAPPPPLILHSESTRRALRDIGRERSFADRAGQDLNGDSRSAFDSKLSAGVSGAARGDCMKGQFKGSNMGLLSLPALALAAANGECAR